jgi:hypothetical protein
VVIQQVFLLHQHISIIMKTKSGLMDHAAGIITDKVTKERIVVVVAGEINGEGLDTTELLFDSQWNQGK